MARVDLYIMRHGDALNESVSGDIGRNLSEYGRSQVEAIRSYVSGVLTADIKFIVSGATRTRETYAIISQGLDVDPVFCEKLYLASPDTIEVRLSEFISDSTPVFLIGHNPGLSYFLSELTGSVIGLSTAEFFHLTYKGNEPSEHAVFDKGSWVTEVSYKAP